MKTHTNQFKENIQKFGRELDSKITYTVNGVTTTLDVEQLNSVIPHYEGAILKSVMKQIDIDSNEEIAEGTVFNYQFGMKIDENENNYEYINFGNYVVYKVEKQEDTGSYKMTCYDKMLYSMKEYEELNVNYPITVRSYIGAICDVLGLTFKNRNSVFANYNREIASDLYAGLEYTYRDVLDELAQVTASTICINEEDDELEIRYINDTEDTIDEEYLKIVNVNFGEKYGPINSIVLSRTAESDNVFLRDESSITNNGLCEIKIKENQIMNFNDRSDYLPDILEKLDGLEYYLNDFTSTGICYYNLCDRYNVKVGENTYSCIMFNDEVDVTQGLEEIIYTELPEESQTDYTKADKIDRKINQTYIIVDKQNQKIESVVSQVNSQNNKISQVTQTVDELNSKISDIANITISGESSFATFTLENVNESEPVQIKIRPINDNISFLYPNSGLFPSDNLFLKVRTIRFYNNTTDEYVDYEIPDDLLFYDNETYDEFYLDYDSQTCQITKRCQYNSDGSVSALENEQIVNYPYPNIILKDGNYTLTLLGYEYGYLFIRLMAKNIYTSQFYTKVETNSRINQKADEIELGINQTLNNYSTTSEMNSAISLTANEITSSVSETYATKNTTNQLSSRIKQTAKTIEIATSDNNTSAGLTIKLKNEDGTQIDSKSANITMSGLVKFTDLSRSGSTKINGSNITTGTINANLITTGSLSADRISGGTLSGQTISGGTIGGTIINTDKDLTVGNNAYIGQTQTSSSDVQKYLYFSSNAYIRRWTINGKNYLRMSSDLNTGLACGSGHVYVMDGIIQLSHNPTIESDKRLKKHIKNLDSSWIDELNIKEYEYKNTPGKKQIGLIAQDYINKDYSKYFLNETTNDDGENYYSIAYGNITNALIKYCQELKKELIELKEEIKVLKNEK